jgi:cold shock protein
MAQSYLSQRLTRPLRTKDGGMLRTVLDARSYMLRISKHRQRSAQWQRVAQLAKADLGAFCRQVELALHYDGKLDVTRMEMRRQQRTLNAASYLQSAAWYPQCTQSFLQEGMEMPNGRVKFFNTDRGYGFIAPDGGGSDVFVHAHDVEAAGMKILVAGQSIAYELGPARDGRIKAVKVRLLDNR